MTLRLGELFAGYGGLGMAVEEVFNAELAWVSEWEAAPSKILKHHWPHIPNHGDVTKIDWANIEPVDIISGGSPCQDLSLAGRRKGMTEGTRSNLWESMREGIATIRPRYVVWENVRGALSAGAISEMEQSEGRLGADGDPNLRALGRVLGDLADLGYDAEWRGLTAANVGATHGRFRVFLLASLPDAGGVGLEAGRLPGGSFAEVTEPANDQPVLSYTHSFRCERCGQAWDGRTRPADHCEPPADASSGGRDRRTDLEGEGWNSGLWGEAVNHPGDSDPSRHSTTPDADCGDDDGRIGNPQWSAQWGEATSGRGEGSSAPTDPQSLGRPERWTEPAGIQRGPDALVSGNQNWGAYEPAVRRWERVNGPAPRPTEPSGRDNAHRLSPAFVEWMMGLPAGWVTDVPGVNRNAQLKALGNGVVPHQAMAALRDMLAAFEKETA